MSSTINAPLGTILPHSSQSWSMHQSSGGWPGNAVVMAQALNPLSKLVVTDLGAVLGGNGVYDWPFIVTNEGPFPVTFQLQVSFV